MDPAKPGPDRRVLGHAAAESFFAALKEDVPPTGVPDSRSARFAVAEYIEVFYNRKRLHSTLG
jgi:putative transposase